MRLVWLPSAEMRQYSGLLQRNRLIGSLLRGCLLFLTEEGLRAQTIKMKICKMPTMSETQMSLMSPTSSFMISTGH